MTTHAEWEEKVAMAAGGDLPFEEVAPHLQECADCRRLAEELGGQAAALRELREVPVSTGALESRVRAAVSPGRRRVWVWAAAAAALLVLGWFGVGRIGKQPAAEVAHQTEAPAKPAETSVPPPRPVVRAEGVRRSGSVMRRDSGKKTAARRKTETLIQMQTDDPDVVIYWIVEGEI